jgi:hypothetical protein
MLRLLSRCIPVRRGNILDGSFQPNSESARFLRRPRMTVFMSRPDIVNERSFEATDLADLQRKLPA